jgi:hypothetical protein
MSSFMHHDGAAGFGELQTYSEVKLSMEFAVLKPLAAPPLPASAGRTGGDQEAQPVNSDFPTHKVE